MESWGRWPQRCAKAIPGWKSVPQAPRPLRPRDDQAQSITQRSAFWLCDGFIFGGAARIFWRCCRAGQIRTYPELESMPPYYFASRKLLKSMFVEVWFQKKSLFFLILPEGKFIVSVPQRVMLMFYGSSVYGFMVLWCYSGFMVLWFYGFMVFWFYVFLWFLWFCGFVVVWFYGSNSFMFSGRYWSHIQDSQHFIRRIFMIFPAPVSSQMLKTNGFPKFRDFLKHIFWNFLDSFLFWCPKRYIILVLGGLDTSENPKIIEMRGFGLSHKQIEKY